MGDPVGPVRVDHADLLIDRIDADIRRDLDRLAVDEDLHVLVDVERELLARREGREPEVRHAGRQLRGVRRPLARGLPGHQPGEVGLVERRGGRRGRRGGTVPSKREEQHGGQDDDRGATDQREPGGASATPFAHQDLPLAAGLLLALLAVRTGESSVDGGADLRRLTVRLRRAVRARGLRRRLVLRRVRHDPSILAFGLGRRRFRTPHGTGWTPAEYRKHVRL